ncbi:VanZ family protein [Trichloromonas sp.]|uniref:VanZ family protein n=1 Tax=Trichloromonas sp. TaxID=3069249 RepID=UPI003D8163EA
MNSPFLKAFAPPVVLMGAIFLLSSVPGEVDDGILKILTALDPKLQNLLHIPLFALLQVLWLRAIVKGGLASWKNVLLCLGITLGYGLFDEIHQMFVPGRYASLLDVLLNLLGAVLGTLGFWWATRKSHPTHSTGLPR